MATITLAPGEHIDINFGEGGKDFREGVARVCYDVDGFRIFISEQYDDDLRKIYEEVNMKTSETKQDGRPLTGLEPPEE